MRKIVLASGSPRRLELLKGYGYDVTVIHPDFDESSVTGMQPCELVTSLALGKNRSVTALNLHDIVLSADTVVCIDGKILGKPADANSAFAMLRSLSGRTHTVYTGVCISYEGHETVFSEKSLVTFYELTDRQINSYISKGSPFDKAGGYGIQDDKGIYFIRSVTGEISNVIGLPMGRVAEEISKLCQD